MRGGWGGVAGVLWLALEPNRRAQYAGRLGAAGLLAVGQENPFIPGSRQHPASHGWTREGA